MGLWYVECKIYRHEVIQFSKSNFGPKFNLTSDCMMLLLRLEIYLCKKIPMIVPRAYAADNHIREAHLLIRHELNLTAVRAELVEA